MRIAEIEERLKQGECTEAMLDAFKAAMERVPKDNRCQHCYTTACAMPERYYSQALDLIRYGLDIHCDCWLDRMRAYHNMAVILEKQGNYKDAKCAYGEALAAVDPAKRSSYQAEYAAHMMRAEMHSNGFNYSEELLQFYNAALQADTFAQMFRKQAFYRAVAETIIFCQQGDRVRARQALDKATDMLHPEHIGPLTQMLKAKQYADTVGATKEAVAFLRKAARSI